METSVKAAASTAALSGGNARKNMGKAAPPAPRRCRWGAGYSHEPMTWRDAMIVAAISALLAAAITVAVRIVVENLTF
jgi:hypothetical protein